MTEYGPGRVEAMQFSTIPPSLVVEEAAALDSRFLVILLKPTSTEPATIGGGGTTGASCGSPFWLRFRFRALLRLPLDG